MSWSASTNGYVPKDEVRAKVVQYMNDHAEYFREPEVKGQVATALNVVEAIVESGAIGSPANLSVNISGHANPDHQPREGWSNDTITVAVSAG